MELAFQTSPLHYLRCILRETRFQEETAEIIVPDSYPDILSIVDCGANVILRGKDCRDGSVTISGGVKGVILYTPEDSTYPRMLEVYLPFSVRFEAPELSDRSGVSTSLRVRSVDARMINSRKAMLRVNLGCEITAYEDGTDQLYQLQARPDHLQVKEAAYEICLPLEQTERAFSISDELRITEHHPPIAQVYKLSCHPELTEHRLVGNKAVFKGIMNCKCLYRAENDSLYLYQQQIPFSQYCELQRDYDEETVESCLLITGYDLEDTVLTIHMLAQCTVFGKKTMNILEDAYSTKGVLDAQWKEYAAESCLDRQNQILQLRGHITGTMRDLLDTDVYWDYPTMHREGDRCRLSVPVSVRVLGYDDAGELCCITEKLEASQELALSEHADCRASVDSLRDLYATVTSDGAEVRCGLLVQTTCVSSQKLRTLCGGTMEEDTSAHVPSVIIRLAEKDTSVWELGKAYRAGTENIKAANHLEGEYLPEDTVVLLPIG